MNITTCLEAVMKSRVDILVRTPNCVIIRVIRLCVSLAWVARVEVFDARVAHLHMRKILPGHKKVHNTKILDINTGNKKKEKTKNSKSYRAIAPLPQYSDQCSRSHLYKLRLPGYILEK